MVPAQKQPEKKPKMRQIIIETDGSMIHIGSCEVASTIEFIGILNSILGMIDSGRLKIAPNFQVRDEESKEEIKKPADVKPEENTNGGTEKGNAV